MASENESMKFLERLKKIEGQLERLANDFFLSDSFAQSTYGSLWRPPADVYETDSTVVVRMEVPGLHHEDISIALHADTVVVRAVRRESCAEAKKSYHQLEIHYGYFERVIPLPRRIRHQEAEAVYDDGFLVITIPKCDHEVELAEILQLEI
ncbi:MAG: Hsp20/alpha crystallin family protein [Candidatus Brocadiia bacterium]